MRDPIDDRPVELRGAPKQAHAGRDEREREARGPVPRWRALTRLGRRLDAIEVGASGWLVAHSIKLLRVSLGCVFLGFGFLKFFPMVSPAEQLVMDTTSTLTFHLVPGSVSIIAIAVLECVIGLWLLSGRALRGAMYLLAIELVGILAPVVVLGDKLFSGPHNAPTLQGQYVLKDVILVAAVLVVAATVRGARLTDGRRRQRRRPVDDRARRPTSEREGPRAEANADDVV
jgi:putative oxidoreductase